VNVGFTKIVPKRLGGVLEKPPPSRFASHLPRFAGRGQAPRCYELNRTRTQIQRHGERLVGAVADIVGAQIT
jgi:hypothetical protein